MSKEIEVTILWSGNTYLVTGHYTPECKGHGAHPDEDESFEIDKIYLVDDNDSDIRIEDTHVAEEHAEEIEEIILERGKKLREEERVEYLAEWKGKI